MACGPVGSKPLSKLMLSFCQSGNLEHNTSNFNQNTELFIHENAYENIVWEKAAILSRGDDLSIILYPQGPITTICTANILHRPLEDHSREQYLTHMKNKFANCI